MKNPNVSVTCIPVLKDNYSYVLTNTKNKDAIIIDPGESKKVLKYIDKKKLNINAILLTHHHSDHIGGVKNILNFIKVPVFSPDKKIFGTTNIVKHDEKINLKFISLKAFATPGHTMDHIVFYSKSEKILFSGDTLFRLGCGKVFEGTYKKMFNSLKVLENLEDETSVFCGHEYTINNLRFLKSIFLQNTQLEKNEKEIKKQLKYSKKTIPFNLGKEKINNPFLCSHSPYYQKFKKNNNFSDFEMFCYLRDLKNKF